jgi:hypothetical protein
VAIEQTLIPCENNLTILRETFPTISDSDDAAMRAQEEILRGRDDPAVPAVPRTAIFREEPGGEHLFPGTLSGGGNSGNHTGDTEIVTPAGKKVNIHGGYFSS